MGEVKRSSSSRGGSKMPRPDDRAKGYFGSLVPEDPRVTTRPMFGNVAAFVNGNMFMGLFGNDVFVRLDEVGRDELRGLGGAEFEPMPGRAMREYVVLPGAWRSRRAKAQGWAARSLDWAAQLPPKAPKGRKPAKRRR